MFATLHKQTTNRCAPDHVVCPHASHGYFGFGDYVHHDDINGNYGLDIGRYFSHCGYCSGFYVRL